MKNYLLVNELTDDRGNNIFRSLNFLRLSVRLAIPFTMSSTSFPENWFVPHEERGYICVQPISEEKIRSTSTEYNTIQNSIVNQVIFKRLSIIVTAPLTSSCPLSDVCPCVSACSQWVDFRNIVYWTFLFKYLEKFEICLKSDKKFQHFTPRHNYVSLLLAT
jgi:hypothetical protein